MPPVVIYTKPFCPYCSRVENLLKKKGVGYQEIVAAMEPGKRAEMVQRSGGRTTYPQIFIGERHVGGCDELMALDARGELDTLLAA